MYLQTKRAQLLRRNRYLRYEIPTFYVLYGLDMFNLGQGRFGPYFDASKDPALTLLPDNSVFYVPFTVDIWKNFRRDDPIFVAFQDLSALYHKKCSAIAVPVELLLAMEREVKMGDRTRRDYYDLENAYFADEGFQVLNEEGKKAFVVFDHIYDNGKPPETVRVSEYGAEVDTTLQGFKSLAEFIEKSLLVKLWPIALEKSQVAFCRDFADTLHTPVLFSGFQHSEPGWFAISAREGPYEVYASIAASHADRRREL